MQRLQLSDAVGPGAGGVDVDPVAEDHVRVRPFRLEGVVVQRLHLGERAVLGVAEVEDCAHPVLTEVVGHLGLGVIGRRRAPGRALLGELLLGLQRKSSPRAPVRMHVDQLHGSSPMVHPIVGHGTA